MITTPTFSQTTKFQQFYLDCEDVSSYGSSITHLVSKEGRALFVVIEARTPSRKRRVFSTIAALTGIPKAVNTLSHRYWNCSIWTFPPVIPFYSENCHLALSERLADHKLDFEVEGGSPQFVDVGTVYQIDGTLLLDIFERIQRVQGANVQYDPDKKEYRFFHDLREIRALIQIAGVSDYFESNLSYHLGPSGYKLSSKLTVCNEYGYRYFASKVKDLIFDATVVLNAREKKVVATDSKSSILELLNKHGALVVGEDHQSTSSKEWLINKCDAFTAQDVDTLFLEHICYDTMQPLLDAYFDDPYTPPELLRLVLEQTYSLWDLVQTYINNGIRVVALDTTTSYYVGANLRDGVTEQGAPFRYLALQKTALEIIQKEKKGKYLAFIGSAHVATCGGIPGLAELLWVPSIVLEGSERESIHRNVQNYFGQISFITALVKTKSVEFGQDEPC